MKKAFLVFLAAVLLAVCCSCTAADSTGDSSGSQSDSNSTEQGNPNGKEILQGVYYSETYALSGDSGDRLTPEEGAKCVAADVLPSELMDTISGDQCIYITFDDLLVLDSADGRECYIYSVATGTVSGGFMGSGYAVQFRASVDYAENQTAIYEDFRTPGNEDDDSSKEDDSGDTEVPNWWGTYNGEEFSVEIGNFNGESFRFTISNLRNGETVFEGVAALDPENDHMAEYEQIGFYLQEDYSTVDFFAAESSQWQHLRGQYQRVD